MEELVQFVCGGSSGFESPEFLIRLFVIMIVCEFLSSIIRSMLRGVWK